MSVGEMSVGEMSWIPVETYKSAVGLSPIPLWRPISQRLD